MPSKQARWKMMEPPSRTTPTDIVQPADNASNLSRRLSEVVHSQEFQSQNPSNKVQEDVSDGLVSAPLEIGQNALASDTIDFLVSEGKSPPWRRLDRGAPNCDFYVWCICGTRRNNSLLLPQRNKLTSRSQPQVLLCLTTLRQTAGLIFFKIWIR